jgi:hypothetical protein
MSPSPSPSPPPPVTSSRPPQPLLRPEINRAPPPPVHATTASIYSASHHEDQPADPEENEDDEDNDDDGYPPLDPNDETGGSLLAPNFRPLFTVITDPQTRETFHPAVYYVFSDDADNEREGNDVATVAALRALDQTAQRAQKHYDQSSHTEENEIEERFIMIDLEPIAEPTGTALKVKEVSSLSPSWAVTSTTLRAAPTFEADSEDSAESLMLQVEGIELAEPTPSGSDRKHGTRIKKEEAERKAANLLQEARKRGGGGIVQGMEEIWKGVNEGLGVLEKVIGEDSLPQGSK